MSTALPCFECGAPADPMHHVVPRSRGGTKTVPLCKDCHGKAHGLKMSAREITQDALRAKKARGERTGSVPFGYTLAPDGVKLLPARNEQATIAEARTLRAAGMSLRAVAGTLFERGHMNRTGGCFAPEHVKRMVAA